MIHLIGGDMETIYNLHDEQLEPRLFNWARWCRSGAMLWPICCVGLESRYRAPQCWETAEPRIAIDLLDAYAIEDAVRTLPKRYRTALKYWHVTRLDPRWIAKRARTGDVGQLMRDAWEALRPLVIKNIDKPIKITYNRHTI